MERRRQGDSGCRELWRSLARRGTALTVGIIIHQKRAQVGGALARYFFLLPLMNSAKAAGGKTKSTIRAITKRNTSIRNASATRSPSLLRSISLLSLTYRSLHEYLFTPRMDRIQRICWSPARSHATMGHELHLTQRGRLLARHNPASYERTTKERTSKEWPNDRMNR